MKLIDADAITYESIDSSDTERHWQYHGTGIIAVRKKDIDEMPPIQSEIIRCKDCKHKPSGNAERKEDNEMSEDMTKPDYEQLCKEYECKIKEQQKQIEGMVKEIEFKTEYIARLEGYIKGLEFAIRCNGVSGAEVKF